jgi:hypothetical protein
MAQTLAFGRQAVVPPAYFGMHFHHATSGTYWPDIGVGAWRLWDAHTAWPNLEPKRDVWDFGELDRAVALAESRKVDLLLPLGLTPTWASARPNESSGYGPGNAAPPLAVADWRNYVRKVATRYRGRIFNYEIWNEPDLKKFYTGTPEQLVALTKAACEELKAVDPRIKLVGPSPTGPQSFRWYESFLQAFGAKVCFDIVGWHLYTTEDPPEKIIEFVTNIKTILAQYGLQMLPIWNTETGYFIENQYGPRVAGTPANASTLVLDAEHAAAYVARELLIAWALGIDRYYWYAWDNNQLGLLDMGDSHREPKPAAQAYRTLQHWLVGAMVTNCALRTGVWQCLIVRDAQTSVAVWVGSGTLRFTIPADWKVGTAQDMTGTNTRVSDGAIEVHETPVLLSATRPRAPRLEQPTCATCSESATGVAQKASR